MGTLLSFKPRAVSLLWSPKAGVRANWRVGAANGQLVVLGGAAPRPKETRLRVFAMPGHNVKEWEVHIQTKDGTKALYGFAVWGPGVTALSFKGYASATYMHPCGAVEVPFTSLPDTLRHAARLELRDGELRRQSSMYYEEEEQISNDW